jgi:hypothetical protein
MNVVEILLYIGVLATLLKGADIILRPKQQAWVQEKFETLTLRLDYTKPLTWYAKFKIRKNRVVLIIVSALLYFILAIGLAWRNWQPYTQYNLMMVAVFTFFVVLEFMDRHRSEHPIIKFLLSGQGFLIFLLRPILILAAGAAIILAYLAIVTVLVWFMISDQVVIFIILLYGSIAILGILITFNIPLVQIEMLAVLSLCIVCVAIFLLVTEGAIRILRGIAWRIVEYNKGAYAAIILFITIILAIIELFMKAKLL